MLAVFSLDSRLTHHQVILLAYRPHKSARRSSWVYLLVLRYRWYCLDMGSIYLFLASTFRCPFRPWPRNRPKICNCSYLYRGMFPCPYPWCTGHAVASVDCVRYRAWRYCICRVRRIRRRPCLAVDVGEHCRRPNHRLCYDLRCTGISSLGKLIYQGWFPPHRLSSSI